MARCDVCGNEYDKSFKVVLGTKTLTFDSLECAIHAIAPKCAHCQCRVLGHGVEADGKIFCCAHCARTAGVQGVVDRVPATQDAAART
jgi:nitrite reductase/ring-hydroxylating ferredoxin subunit